MIDVLHTSIENINSMGEAHDQQSDVIRNTVEINEHIAESIKQENTEFCSINGMVENNTKDICGDDRTGCGIESDGGADQRFVSAEITKNNPIVQAWRPICTLLPSVSAQEKLFRYSLGDTLIGVLNCRLKCSTFL